MDFGHLDLGAGRRLLLTGGGLGWLWLLAGVAALGLVLALYRYERRLVSRRAGLMLLGLRLAAGLALVFALFDPIAAVTYRESVRGRVVVGVDLSDSMATADPGRSAEARERLRRALDLSANEPVEALTRREVARRLVVGDWLQRLGRAHDVEALGFARDAVPGTPATLAEALGRPAGDDLAGRATDWAPVLARALEVQEQAPVAGVVLLTDGRRNAAGDPGALADKLAARGVPVYPVLIGSTRPPVDAAVAALKAPEGVYKGDTATIDVTVKLDAPAGTEIPVTLDRPGASPLRKTVRAPGDGSRPVATFALAMEEVGPQELTVAVGPLPGDLRPDNDRRTLTIQVADDQAHVLLVDGEARWEFQYLRNALARDRRVTFEAVVFHQPTTSAAAEPQYKAALPPKPESGPDPLGSFDVIILGDVDPADVPPADWARLDAYTAGRGGTLVLTSGPKHGLALLGQEPYRKLLPVSDAALVPVAAGEADPTRPTLPPGVALLPQSSASADAWPMLQFAAEPERSRAIWAGLPRLPWVLAGRAKPSATALVSVAADAAPEGTTTVAALPYGLGKVLWVGTDGTWRWRYRVGDAYHHRFWGQVVRWAAAGRLAAGNRLVRFGPESPRIAEGDGVTVRARFADDAAGVRPDLLVAARIFRAPKPDRPSELGDPVAVLPLRPRADQPRAFEGPAPALPAGRYVIRLDVPQLADAFVAEGPAPEATLEVTPRETSERVELAALRDPLDRLAAATKGRVFTDEDAAGLPDLLTARTLVKVRTEETPLWDRPVALVLFFAVLSVEWIVRKRAGLP